MADDGSGTENGLLPPPPPPTEPLAEGQVHCPGCGEALYGTEERCWRCGRRLAASPPPPPPPPAAVGSPVPKAPGQLPPPESQAVAAGIGALMVSALGVITCIGAPVCVPLALWLASRAKRGGAPGLATAARVVSFVALLSFLVTLVVWWAVDFGRSVPPPS